jgi:hypothetical protein
MTSWKVIEVGVVISKWPKHRGNLGIDYEESIPMVEHNYGLVSRLFQWVCEGWEGRDKSLTFGHDQGLCCSLFVSRGPAIEPRGQTLVVMVTRDGEHSPITTEQKCNRPIRHNCWLTWASSPDWDSSDIFGLERTTSHDHDLKINNQRANKYVWRS